MRKTTTNLLLISVLSALLFAGSLPARAAPLPPEAERVARDFLYAFSRNDRGLIQSLLPSAPSKLYGPCPFDRMPQISQPRADGRVAAVNFDGPMSDPNLPSRGLILLRLVEEGGKKGWRVRQVYCFRELPSEAGDLPERSPTESDRRQEPAVRQAAIEFIRAWLHGDWDRMAGLTFEWWKLHRRPPRWAKLVSVDLEEEPTTLDGIRVDFQARVRFVSLFSRTISGNLWLVKEDGRWRVRPITLSLLF